VVPSDRHFEVAKDVLESGRHLLLEKPMALSIDDCTALVRLAAARDRILAVGHELRLSSLWGKVKELVGAGEVGDVQHVSIDLWRHAYRQGIGRWRYDPARVGDWVLEEPIHFFDLARWYLGAAGEPVSVYAVASGPNPRTPALFDNFSATVRFPGNRHAVVTQSLNAWEHHQAVKLTGTDGAILATWSGRTARTREATSSLRLQRGRADPEFPENATLVDVPIDRPAGEVYELDAQVAAVARAVRDGTPVPCTGVDGWWSVATCLKAAESISTGALVQLPRPT
jgi:myo-inositol 2-dehydrogenase/D-chiro-inositol 1-dehydrogenase